MRSRTRFLVLLLSATGLDRLGNLLGHLTALEDGDGASAGIGLHQFHTQCSEGDKGEEEGPEEAKVAPEM
jgi:hypothetical protein